MNDIGKLRRVILELHNAKAKHVQSVPVREEFKGQVVWDGVVEVFALQSHPKTNRIYAWAHDTDDPVNPKRYVTVLHIPPVVSPQTAVKAAVVQELRESDRSQKS